MPLDWSPFQAEVDQDQPWQTQRVERTSRAINSGSPYVKRQLRLLALWVGAIVLALVAAYLVTTLR